MERQMKRLICFMTAVLALAVPLAVRAQDTAPTDSARPQVRTPDQILRMYDTRLTLTDEQKEQLRPIIADRQQKLQDLRADTSMRPRQKLKKLEDITAASDKKINAVLTPDQQKKYAEIEKQMREQAKERRQQGQNNAN
jgi:Spy/CpxP family protein refolding chaperone